mmetsp:Transcript_152968/g.285028  ORF Transcript_152968/g.285028 Transcript_152968/m.285028 type:complete len:666 (+) Transcript_152968:77-2074(+)
MPALIVTRLLFLFAVPLVASADVEPPTDACPAGAEGCEAAAATDVETEALVQTRRIVHKRPSGVAREYEDTGLIEEEAEMHGSYLPRASPSFLQTSNLLQQLNVHLFDDDNRAKVTFLAGGEKHEYELEAVSAYAIGANITIWNGKSFEYMDLGKPRTFRSQNLESMYARVRINEDNSVSGFFEHKDGSVMSIEPLKATREGAEALLQAFEGKGQAHVFEWVPPVDIANNPYNVNNLASLLQQDPHDGEPDGGISGDPDQFHEVPAAMERGLGTLDLVNGFPKPPWEFTQGKPWTGTKWYPGCYAGDKDPHTFDIGFVIPPNVFKPGPNSHDWQKKDRWPTPKDAKPRWEDILTKASFVYEKQMNLHLKLAEVKVATEPGQCWADAGYGCGRVRARSLNTALDAFKECMMVPFLGAYHIFTNCHTVSIGGLGFLGTLCDKKVNKGSDLWFSHDAWFIFAHELGHNFAAKHTQEEPWTGIMAGTGKKDGHYQFNTKYRKPEVCGELSDIEGCPHLKNAKAGPTLAPNQRPRCVWSSFPRHFSGGYADGISDKFTLEEGKAKCVEIGKWKCKAVTCPQGRDTGCTLRATTKLKPYHGEDSYTVADYICSMNPGAPAPPPPTPAPQPGPPLSPADDLKDELESLENRMDAASKNLEKVEKSLKGGGSR